MSGVYLPVVFQFLNHSRLVYPRPNNSHYLPGRAAAENTTGSCPGESTGPSVGRRPMSFLLVLSYIYGVLRKWRHTTTPTRLLLAGSPPSILPRTHPYLYPLCLLS